jgi:His/Glu/Gln/Arg/opine family amino acid ABC transporter permease subunit
MDARVITDNWPLFMRGLRRTGELTVVTVIAGTVGGTLLALTRRASSRAVRYAAGLFVETVRATPPIMLIFWFYFLVPRLVGQAIDGVAAGLLALVLFNCAYTAEIVRAGIQGIPAGQAEAARASGLAPWRVMRHIVLPQAFDNMTPALINQAVMVFKTTSLVYIIGVIDFFRAATLVNNRVFRPYEIYLFVGLVYLIPATLFSQLSRALEKRRARARV